MADIKLKTRIALRADTKENWNDVANSLVPLKGEFCITLDETGGPKIKVGDGTSLWSALKYINATPEELSAYGVREVKIEGTGNVITNASFSAGILTLTRGTISYNAKTGSTNGTIAFGIPGAETDVAVAGLKSAAYTESTAYDAAGTGAAEAKKVQGNTTSTVKTVEDAAAAAASAASAAQGTADSANELAQTALQNVSVAGKTLTKGSNTISADEIKTAMGLGAAAVKNVDEAISNETSVNLPTTKAVVDKVNNMIAALGNVLEFKGVKTYDEIIAIADAQIGDVWITEDGKEYVCTTAATAGAENWEELGTTVDLSGYLTTEVADDTYATISNLSAHTGDANIHVTSTDKTNWNGKTTMGEVEAKGYQTAAQVKAIKVDNATHAEAADNATNLGGQPASYYAPASSIPTVPIQSVVGNNGVTASLAGTTVTVGLNLTDVFVLNGGNAAGTYA